MPEDSETDDLLRRLSEGDPAAGRLFVQKYARELTRNICLSLRPGGVHNGAWLEAHSVLNSTVRSFLERQKKGGLKFGDVAGVFAYLKVISLNKITKRIRKSQRQNGLVDNGVDAASIADRSPPPEDTVADRLRAAELLASLGPSDRRLLKMAAEDFTIRQIAEALGLSNSTVHRRLRDIKKRLKGQNDGE